MLDELTAEEWDRCLAINLEHQLLTARVVLARMKAREAGTVINMSSTTPLVGAGGMSAYSAAKAGVIGLSRGIARDYGVYGIRCNVVAPGWIMTERQLKLWYSEAAGEKLDRPAMPEGKALSGRYRGGHHVSRLGSQRVDHRTNDRRRCRLSVGPPSETEAI